MIFNDNLELNTDNVRKFVDDYSLLSFYIPEFKGVGKYKSNLRGDDENHSLYFKSRNGRITVSDFGRTEYIGLTTYKYLQIYFDYPDTKYGYMLTLSKIVLDFRLPINTISDHNIKKSAKKPKIYNIKLENTKDTEIRVKRRPWFSSKEDIKFWGIIANKDSLLQHFNNFSVNALSHYWINGVRFTVKNNNPTYSFRDNVANFKLYSPYANNFKWISNIKKTSIIGWNHLPEKGEILIIEKSVKDAIIIEELLNIPSIPMNSESMFISKSLFNNLQKRFITIIAHFDNDNSGIKAAKKIKEIYNISTFYFPKEMPKDNYDVIKLHGKQVLKKLLNKYIKKQ